MDNEVDNPGNGYPGTHLSKSRFYSIIIEISRIFDFLNNSLINNVKETSLYLNDFSFS